MRLLTTHAVDKGTLMSLSWTRKAILKWRQPQMLSQGTEGEIQTQCVVGSQLWSIPSKASCMAHLWSVLPGTCINWAYNWIVVFISSTLLLSSLGYGLQRKCLYLLVLRKLIECTLSSWHAHHCVVIPVMRNYCQLQLTSDNVRVPRATVALHNTKEMQNRPQETACLNGNNQPVINILVALQAGTQTFYLHKGVYRKSMWH